MEAEWDRLDKVLNWIASHSDRFRRKDYTPPNHLSNGTIKYKQSGDWQSLKLDYEGKPTAKLMIETDQPLRVEVYGGSSELLFTEEV